jgi:hypothetical protein
MKRSIILATVLLFSVFFVLAPANSSAQAEKPDWQIGDSWSMGKKVDLSKIEQDIKDILDQIPNNDITLHLSGGVGAYQTMKVVDDDVMVDGVLCYKNSIKGAIGVNANGDFTMSMNDPSMGQISGNGQMTAMVSVWIDGYQYFTVDEIATKKMDLTVKTDFKIEATIEMTSSGVTQNMEVLLEATGVQMHILEKYTPALDMLDFPIEDGETWRIPDVETTVEMEMSSEGSVRTKLSGSGYSTDTSVPLSNLIGSIPTTTVIDPDDPFYPQYMNASAEKVGSVYEITMELDSLMLPSPSIGYDLPTIKFIYDPGQGYFTSSNLEINGETISIMEPTTEEEVDSFYLDPVGSSVPSPGLELWLILVIVGIVVAVIVAVAAIIIVKRKKPPEVQPAPPVAPPGTTQPPPGQIPPQQPPQRP